ncbi:Kelch repeat-containing protein [Paramyrothecium foliicola]|nr:Kelch repeat-containing protein [Paramyrothecium foliicola]
MSPVHLSATPDAGSDSAGCSDTTSFSRIRPHFNSQVTSDRLREGSKFWQPPFRMSTNLRKGRRSVFKELGLDDDFTSDSADPRPTSSTCEKRPHVADDDSDHERERLGRAAVEPENSQLERRQSKRSSSGSPRQRQRRDSNSSRPWYAKLANPKGRPRIKSASGAPPGSISGLQRFTMITLLIAVVIPAFSYYNGHSRVEISGADAGPVFKRQDSPTEVCIRWAHQAAAVNGTLFIYGGEAKAEADQEQNTWNNNFLTLDLTRDWDASSPALRGLPIPDGPPAVALGYLWNDYNNLYLYGGQFSSKPYIDPGPESLWRYSINDGEWSEIKGPETSAGNYSEPEGQPVHRSAEGAGISVPELGLSWYFGGHLDWATTPGWSRNIERVYLKSLLEFTHPGYVNSGVDSLSEGTGAGENGAFRNITEGGVQADEFSERADGVLVFVPGWGEQGVLIGLAGGTNDTFVRDLEILNIYDIANSEWYHQQADGDIPGVRVNPCAVVASASDASSFQIYLFGGQNLQPTGDQIQYDDMYILTIPSFTWIKVDQSDQDVPRPRAGHTCHLRDSQMIVVGGYIGNEPVCESPGVFVFDASSLEWKDSFSAGDHPDDYSIENTVEAGSYGYKVPAQVREVIGGDEDGSATATAPGASATDGPFATGKPPVFTVTQTGATATITNWGPQGTSPGGGDGPSEGGGSGGSNISPGLIAAAVIAGIAGAAAFYLGFCAWLYRRQVNAYKQHVAVANRYPGVSNQSLAGGGGGFWGRRHSSRRTQASAASWAWPGSDREPTWMSEPKWISSDEHPSSSGTGSAQGSGGPKNSEDTRPGTSNSGGSTEGLLEGQEPSFFSVVMGPRRALRVVNGIDERS